MMDISFVNESFFSIMLRIIMVEIPDKLNGILVFQIYQIRMWDMSN